MAYLFKAACSSLKGDTREHNEDNFYFRKKHLPMGNRGMRTPIQLEDSTDETQLFAVFDGMGGESCGELAAYTACCVFSAEIKKHDDEIVGGKAFLINTATLASEEIYAISEEKKLGTMGATVAALYFFQDEVYACNVGDSRIFRVRAGRMTQISEDHTDERLMQAMGIHNKPVLLQFLGYHDGSAVIDPFIAKGDIMSDDVYVICSDGVTDALTPTEIYETLKLYPDPCAAVKRITDLVNKSDAADNATVIVVRIK